MKRELSRAETRAALAKIGGEPSDWGTYGQRNRARGLQRFGAVIETPFGVCRLRGVMDWFSGGGPEEQDRGRCTATGRAAAVQWATGQKASDEK
jgi:hypothetical protein